MRNAFLAMGMSCFLLQGCSHFTTYQAGLGEPTTGVSMDAQQRMLLVNKKAAGEEARRMCAEPSPDVMSAIGASMSASLFGSGSASKALSGALSQNVQNIGLRTQSIQLMRDMMYRVCEGYLNYAYDADDYMSLQAQAQGLVVGLLAIEQLTGAVKSDQGSITTNASSGAMPNADEQADRLVEAETAQSEKAREFKDAQAALKKATDAVQANKNAEVAARANGTDTTKILEARPDLENVAKEAAREHDLQRDQLKTADARLKMAQEAYARARSAVTAATSGRSEFSSSNRTYNWNGETVAKLGDNVERIVARVISRSEVERCFELTVNPAIPRSEVQAFCDGARKIEYAKSINKMASRGMSEVNIGLMQLQNANASDATKIEALKSFQREAELKLFNDPLFRRQQAPTDNQPLEKEKREKPR